MITRSQVKRQHLPFPSLTFSQILPFPSLDVWVKKERKETEKRANNDKKQIKKQEKCNKKEKTNYCTRASVEYNGMELIVSLLIFYKYINNYDKLIEKIEDISKNPTKYPNIIFNDFNVDFKNYKNDIYKKPKLVKNYITNFMKIRTHEKFQKKIKSIYICGKNNKHKKINELNKGLDKKDAKGDIYIDYVDKEIIGISVKQSVDATKSNYSVQKILGNDLDKKLTKVKKGYLKKNGFLSFKKIEREQINKLFYPENKKNTYWITLKKEIKNNNKKIIGKLIELLYSLNVKYEMYEFDGKNFKKLNEPIDLSTVKFEEHQPYYSTKYGEERKAAKLFYRLSVGEKKYRVEIRWKGNIYDASPQFQIHNDN